MCGPVQTGEKFELPKHVFPAEGAKGCSAFSFQLTQGAAPLSGSVESHAFAFLHFYQVFFFWLVILLYKIAPRHSGGVLSSVPK